MAASINKSAADKLRERILAGVSGVKPGTTHAPPAPKEDAAAHAPSGEAVDGMEGMTGAGAEAEGGEGAAAGGAEAEGREGAAGKPRDAAAAAGNGECVSL